MNYALVDALLKIYKIAGLHYINSKIQKKLGNAI